jgi:hypothetical protein
MPGAAAARPAPPVRIEQADAFEMPLGLGRKAFLIQKTVSRAS